MNAWRTVVVIGVLAGVLACLPGCLRRKETLRVARDGSVQCEVAIEDDSQPKVLDAEGPDPAGGWVVDVASRTDDRGNITWSRTGRLSVPPGGDLPARFVLAAQPGDIYLEFPTNLLIEQRDEGTYYHFRRVYQPVPWRLYDWPSSHILESDRVKKVLDTDQAEWTEEQYLTVCYGLLRAKLEHRMFVISQGLAEVAGDLPQDVRLRIRGDVMRLAETFDWTAVKEALKLPAEQRDQRLEALGSEFEAAVEQTAKAAGEAYLPADRLEAIQAAAGRVEKRYKTMESYGGQAFEITVYLPGEIIGHNGDKADDSSVTFVFDGKAFRDRPHELLATSFVPADSP